MIANTISKLQKNHIFVSPQKKQKSETSSCPENEGSKNIYIELSKTTQKSDLTSLDESLETENPLNNPKYARLFAAIFGMKEVALFYNEGWNEEEHSSNSIKLNKALTDVGMLPNEELEQLQNLAK